MSQIHNRYATVAGHQLFYREAGPARRSRSGAAARVPHQLVHVPQPDSATGRSLPGDRPGPPRLRALSDAPPVEEFDYSFDALTDLTAGLLDALGISRYAMYVQDYGAPIGWRLALRNPDAITAIITQNGNGYDAGFIDSFWKTVWDYQDEQTPNAEAAIRQALTLEVIRWQYLHRCRGRPTLVSPDTWAHDYALLHPPGQRPDPARAVPRLRHQSPAVPATARVPAHQSGAGTGGMGPRRRDLRTRRCARLRRGRATTPRSTYSTAVTSCWRAPATRSRR